MLKWPVRMISGFVHAPVSLPSIRIRSEIFGTGTKWSEENTRKWERETDRSIGFQRDDTIFRGADNREPRHARFSGETRDARKYPPSLSLFSRASPLQNGSRIRQDGWQEGKKIKRASKGKKGVGRRASLSDCRKWHRRTGKRFIAELTRQPALDFTALGFAQRASMETGSGIGGHLPK